MNDFSFVLWLLLPLAIYVAFALALRQAQRKVPLLAMFRAPLHLVALALCFRLSLVHLPPAWAKPLEPYGTALVLFTVLVWIIQVVEALVVGYFMGRLQKRVVPGILRQFSLLVAYFLVAMIILRSHLNLDVTSLLATSAVLSFVVGLASQDLLGSILAGIVIGVERPITKDNWMDIGGQEGKVVDIAWRRTRIETRNGDFLLVPNSSVMKETITNYTLPDPRHRLTMKVGVHYRHPPNLVKRAMLNAARLCPEVLTSPEPTVFLMEFGDSAIAYRLNAWINDYGRLEHIRDEINTHIWYEFKRQDIEIPFPIRTLYRPRKEVEPVQAAERQTRRVLPLLKAVDLFGGLPEPVLTELAGRVRVATFGGGEVLFKEGEAGRSFYLVLAGKAQVIKSLSGGAQRLLATLGPGDYFGEMSLLLDEPRNATVRLEEDSELVEVEREQFKALMEGHPEFLDTVSRMMQDRQQDNEQLKALFADQKVSSDEGRVRLVLRHIKQVLGL